jgi:hypothetical protein
LLLIGKGASYSNDGSTVQQTMQSGGSKYRHTWWWRKGHKCHGLQHGSCKIEWAPLFPASTTPWYGELLPSTPLYVENSRRRSLTLRSCPLSVPAGSQGGGRGSSGTPRLFWSTTHNVVAQGGFAQGVMGAGFLSTLSAERHLTGTACVSETPAIDCTPGIS